MRLRTLSLVIILLLALGVLAGCGGRNAEPTEAPVAEEAPAEEAPAEEEAPVEEEAPTEEAAAEEAPAEEEVAEGAEEAVAEESAEEEAAEGAEEAPAEETLAEVEVAATEEEAPAEEAPAEEAAAEGAEEAAAEESAEEEAAEGAEEAPAEEAPAEEEAAEGEEEASAEETAAEEVAAESEAASTGAVTIESARSVRDILNEAGAFFTAISPDGAMMVYATTEGRFWNVTNSICLFTFANSSVNCTEVDRDVYMGYMPSFEWSPDSTMVAFTENPIQLGHESDIWVLDVADGSLNNLTDDGVIGSWSTQEQGTFALDYEPMWDESTGDLYFWRSVPTGELAITFQLMKIPAGGGEAELVHDISEPFAGMVVTWDIEDYFLDGPSAMSPDGSKIAIVAQAFQNAWSDERTGVWMLDVVSGELTQVAGSEALGAAIPAWQEARPWARAAQWTGDSEGFIFLVISASSRLPMTVFYYVDAATGEITPIVDFSGVESLNAMMTAPAGEIPQRFYSPWTASISPMGDKLFMISDLAGVAGLFSASLPPSGESPELAGTAESFGAMGGTRSSTAETGKMVIYGFLLTTVEE